MAHSLVTDEARDERSECLANRALISPLSSIRFGHHSRILFVQRLRFLPIFRVYVFLINLLQWCDNNKQCISEVQAKATTRGKQNNINQNAEEREEEDKNKVRTRNQMPSLFIYIHSSE